VVNRPGALGPPWIDDGADRGCRSAATRSPEYSLRPLRCTKARRRGCKRERGAWGARLGPHRSSGGGVEAGRRRCRIGGGDARWKRGSSVERTKRGWERCGEVRGWCSPFYRGPGSAVEGWPGFNTGVNGFNTIEDGGGGLRGELRGGGK
jgi:hypothetical protein